MAGFDGGGRAKLGATAFLASATLLFAVAPTLAQEEPVGGYSVSLAGVAPFDGGIEAKTFRCPTRGDCVARVRVEVRGRTYDYFVFAKATATTTTIGFFGRDHDAPELTTRSGGNIEVSRAPDGSGRQDATLMAVNTSGIWHTTKPYTLRETLPPRLPVANLRVTVRRDEAAQPDR